MNYIVNCLLTSLHRRLPTAHCVLFTADYLLHLRGVRVSGTLRPHSSLGQNVLSAAKEETVVTLKMKERRGNVYENKESASHSPDESANVVENTGSYTS